MDGASIEFTQKLAQLNDPNGNGGTQTDDTPFASVRTARDINMNVNGSAPPSAAASRTNSDENLLKLSPKGTSSSSSDARIA